jgi:hypothetical protein
MGETDVDLLAEEEEKTIALVPGKFKPPHRGHLDMVKHYAGLAKTVKVMISPLPKDDITWEESKQIWEIYLQDAIEDLSNVVVMKSPQNSPVGASFDFVENKNSNPDFAQDGDKVILGASTKGGDQSRFAGSVQKYADRNPMGDIKVLNPMDFVFDPIPPELSATDFREALKTGDDIAPWIPPESHGSIEAILNILGAEKKTLTLESLFSLVEEVLFEAEDIGTPEQISKEIADIGKEEEEKEKKLDDLKDTQNSAIEDSEAQTKEAEIEAERSEKEKDLEDMEEASGAGGAAGGQGAVQGAPGMGKREKETLIREEG